MSMEDGCATNKTQHTIIHTMLFTDARTKVMTHISDMQQTLK